MDSSVGLAGGLRARETSVCRRGTDGRADTGGWLVECLAAGQPPLGGTLALAEAGTGTDGRRRGFGWRVSRVWRAGDFGIAGPGVESCGTRDGVEGGGGSGDGTRGTAVGETRCPDVGGTTDFDGTADVGGTASFDGTTPSDIATANSVSDQHTLKAPRRWRSLSDISAQTARG